MMRKHIPAVLSIAVLTSVLNIGCDEDSNVSSCKTEGFVSCNGTCVNPRTSVQYCGANEYCEGYVTCKSTETCHDGRCRPITCESDKHHYEAICEKDSEWNCGEHGFKCAEKVEGWKSGTCVDKVCTPNACTAGRHLFENRCVLDDINHCGSHDTNCSSIISGWADGTCENGACKVTSCQNGLHVYNNSCETDDTDNCGNHDASCISEIDGWASGTCVKSQCSVSQCISGMHVYNKGCEPDTVENCGQHGLACANTVPGWKTGACTLGICKILQCIDGFHIDAETGECVQDTSTCCGSACIKCDTGLVCAAGECQNKCKNGETYCKGECINIKTSTTNCGGCGHDCNAEMPENAQTMTCSNSSCRIATCKENHHIADNACVPDTETNCNSAPTDCTQLDGWNTGSCENGICIPESCKENYHIAKNDNYMNWCEPDNTLNCGGHGITCSKLLEICKKGKCACAEGWTSCGEGENAQCVNVKSDANNCGKCGNACNSAQSCIDGICIDHICNGIFYDIRNDLDHCGKCHNRCPDSKICKDGQCADGSGLTYCNGNKLNTNYDIDNCGACHHQCGNGLICSFGVCTSGTGPMYCSNTAINSLNDSAHCGECNHKCPVGAYCAYGSCHEKTDPFSSTLCSGIEIFPYRDSANCGQCGKKCDVGQICSNGSCTTGTGSTYCGNISINTSNDPVNCGQCGNTCTTNKLCHEDICTAPSVGNIISFGHYEQDDDTSNGKEPIEWRVLDINSDGHLLIISDKVLDPLRYNTTEISINWERSTIRSWLNGYGSTYNTAGTSYTSDNFIDTAFTSEEKARIIASNVPAHVNPRFPNTPPGNATTDKIFLLSVVEVNNYFTTQAERKAYATFYAVCNGVSAYNYDTSSTCTFLNGFVLNKCSAGWWLRSPGHDSYNAANVDDTGEIDYDDCNDSFIGVRPALWLNLN